VPQPLAAAAAAAAAASAFTSATIAITTSFEFWKTGQFFRVTPR